MKTTQVAPRNKDRGHTSARLTFVEILSLVAFVAGSWYLWVNNVIPLYAKTSVFTVIGGITAFVIGQVVQKGYIEPFQEMQKAIGEVSSALLVYANTSDQQVNEELKQEASRAFRKLSGDLLGKRRVILHYHLFEKLELLPSKKDVGEVVKDLVLLSNSVGSGNYEIFDDAAARIKTVLWLDF